jgi:hypothetical protein
MTREHAQSILNRYDRVKPLLIRELNRRQEDLTECSWSRASVTRARRLFDRMKRIIALCAEAETVLGNVGADTLGLLLSVSLIRETMDNIYNPDSFIMNQFGCSTIGVS